MAQSRDGASIPGWFSVSRRGTGRASVPEMKLGTLGVGVAVAVAAAAVALAACTGGTVSGTGATGGSSSSSTSSGKGGGSVATGGSSSSSTSSGKGSDGGCPVATMGCVPGTTRYLGPCGEFCQSFGGTTGSLIQTCDATGNWGASQCNPPGDCGSGSTGAGCANPCDGGCTNLMGDPQNCGACGNACSANETCTNGACSCPTPCGTACPDLQTDPQNCGACGTTCSSGQSCADGACVLAWTSGHHAGALATNGSTLFLSSYSTGPSGMYNYGRVYAGPTAPGGAATLLYDDPDMNVVSLAADASFVYALDELKSRLLAIPQTGGGLPIVLASGFGGGGSLAIGDGYAFWVGQSGVVKAPLACGATTLVHASTPLDTPGYLVTNPSELFWTGGTEDVFGVPLGGGTPQTLASYTFCSGSLAADAAHVYCLAGNAIAAVPVGGGTMQNIVTGISPAYQSSLAVDATSLYWADMSGIKKAPIAGGSATAYPFSGSPTGPLVIDATNVYWAMYQGIAQTPK